MEPETLEALKGSIAKWEAIVAGTGQDEGPANCPLCRMFHALYSEAATKCIGCPVMDITGKSGCEGTPYERIDDEDEDSGVVEREELDFLKSLLPPGFDGEADHG